MDDVPSATPGSTVHHGVTKPINKLGVTGWVLYDWAQQPFYTLIGTFIFAPYFTQKLVADPAAGQSLWGLTITISSLIIAVFGPIAGGVADLRGRFKLITGIFSMIAAGAAALLWFAEPGAGLPLFVVMMAVVVLVVSAEMGVIFNNAMIPSLVPSHYYGRVSGLGFGVGYLGGIVSLLIYLSFFATVGDSGQTLFGLTPILGLSEVPHGGERAIGPFSALWLILFALPFFLFTPDTKDGGVSLSHAIRVTVGDLRSAISRLFDNRTVLLFLIANMMIKNGLTGVFMFGGIYGAYIFGWSTVDLGIFGIILLISGAIGAVLGGYLDDWFGPYTVTFAALLLSLTGSFLVISIDAETIFFIYQVSTEPVFGAVLGTTAEMTYVACAMMIGICLGPLQSATRSLMAHLSPPGKVAEYFGLFALTSKGTTFVAPLMISALTTLSGDQRVGVTPILFFFGLAVVFLLMARPRTKT